MQIRMFIKFIEKWIFNGKIYKPKNKTNFMGKLIIPKTYIKNIDTPLIFLAGPIKSAPNWHEKIIKILFSLKKDLIIASPKKEINDNLKKYLIINNENYFSRQRAWERHYLEIASKKGVILFWLPKEENHNCDKVYGAMTRVELGQWMTNYKHNENVNFCVGTDGKFSEIGTIIYDLSLDAPKKYIQTTLENTCIEALNLIETSKI